MSEAFSLNRTILVAEDDPDDQLLIKEAFVEARFEGEVRFVGDGDDLLDCLYGRGSYDGQAIDRPDLLLLDMNMPRVDGCEVLSTIKGDPVMKTMPVVVLSTSSYSVDVARAYELGVNAYVIKPGRYDALVEVISAIKRHWIDVVEQPPRRSGG